MTDIEKAIQEFEDNAFHNSLKPTISEESKANALKALQEKAEREKGCEYCNGGKSDGACDSDGMMRIDKGSEHCLPYIAVNNDTFGTSDLFDINYCPMCGRKLGKNDDSE